MENPYMPYPVRIDDIQIATEDNLKHSNLFFSTKGMKKNLLTMPDNLQNYPFPVWVKFPLASPHPRLKKDL